MLVDGKTMERVFLNTTKVQGKEIMTIEGLSERDREVYTWAFSEAGAVQCDFCISRMIIISKGLLNYNLNPTQEEVKNAIKGI